MDSGVSSDSETESTKEVILFSGELNFHEANVKKSSAMFQRVNSFNWKQRFVNLKISLSGVAVLAVYKIKDGVPKLFPNDVVSVTASTVCSQMNLGNAYCFSVTNGKVSCNFNSTSASVRDEWVKMIDKTIVMSMRLSDGDIEKSLHTHYVADFVANLETELNRSLTVAPASESQEHHSASVVASSTDNTPHHHLTPQNRKSSFLNFKSLGFSRKGESLMNLKEGIATAPPKSQLNSNLTIQQTHQRQLETATTLSEQSTSPMKPYAVRPPVIPRAPGTPTHHHHFTTLSVAYALNANTPLAPEGSQSPERLAEAKAGSNNPPESSIADNSNTVPYTVMNDLDRSVGKGVPVDAVESVASKQRRTSGVGDVSDAIATISSHSIPSTPQSSPERAHIQNGQNLETCEPVSVEAFGDLPASLTAAFGVPAKRDNARRGIGLGKSLSLQCQIGGDDSFPRKQPPRMIATVDPVVNSRSAVHDDNAMLPISTVIQLPISNVISDRSPDANGSLFPKEQHRMKISPNRQTAPLPSLDPEQLLHSQQGLVSLWQHTSRSVLSGGSKLSTPRFESDDSTIYNNNNTNTREVTHRGPLNLEMIMLTRENQALSLMNEQLNSALESIETEHDSERKYWQNEITSLKNQIALVETEKEQHQFRIDQLSQNLVTSSESLRYTQEKLKESSLKLHRCESQVAKSELEVRHLMETIRERSNSNGSTMDLLMNFQSADETSFADDASVRAGHVNKQDSDNQNHGLYTEMDVEQIFQELSSENDAKDEMIRQITAELDKLRRQIADNNHQSQSTTTKSIHSTSPASKGFTKIGVDITESLGYSPDRNRKLKDNEIMALVSLNESLQRQLKTVLEQRNDWEKTMKEASERSSSRTRLELMDESTVSVAKASFLETIRKQLESELLASRVEENKYKQLAADYHHQMEELYVQLEEYQQRNDNLSKIQIEFEKIFSDYNAMKAEHIALTNRNESLVSDAIAAIGEREAIDQELIKLKAVVREREHKQLVEVEGLNQQISDFESKINAMVLAASTHERKLNASKDRITNLSAELEEAYRAKTLISSAHSQLSHEFEEFKMSSARQIKEIQDKNLLLEREVSGDSQRFRRELEILERRIEGTEYAKSEMKTKLIETEKFLHKTTDENFILKNSNSALQDKVDALESDASRQQQRHQEQITEFELSVEHLKQQLMESKLALESNDQRRQHDAERNSEKIRELSSNIITAEAANRRLEESLQAATLELQLEKELGSERISRYKSSTETMQVKLRDLERNNTLLEGDRKCLRETTSKTIESLKTELSELKTETSTQTAALTFAKRAFESNSRALQEMANEKANVENEKFALSLQLQESKVSLDGVRKQFQLLRLDHESQAELLTASRVAQSSAQEKLEFTQQTLEIAENKASQLQEQLSCALSSKREQESRIQHLELEIAAMASELNEKVIDTEVRSRELNALRDQLAKATAEKEENRLKLEEMVNKVEEMAATSVAQEALLVTVNASLDEMTRKNSSLESSNADMETSLIQVQEAWKQQDAEISAQIAYRNDLKEVIDTLKSNISMVVAVICVDDGVGTKDDMVNNCPILEESKMCPISTDVVNNCEELAESSLTPAVVSIASPIETPTSTPTSPTSPTSPTLLDAAVASDEIIDACTELVNMSIRLVCWTRDRERSSQHNIDEEIAKKIVSCLESITVRPDTVIEWISENAPDVNQTPEHPHELLSMAVDSEGNMSQKILEASIRASEVHLQLKSSLDAAKTLLDRANHRVEEAIKQVQETMHAQQESNNKHANEMRLLQDDINQYAAESDAMQDNHEKDLAFLKAQHEQQLNEVVAKAERRLVEEAERLASIFESQADQFRSQKRELQTTMESMAHMVSNDKARIDAINTEFVTLRKKITDSESGNRIMEEIISNQKSEISTLQQLNSELHAEIESLQAGEIKYILNEEKCNDSIKSLESELANMARNCQMIETQKLELIDSNKALSDEKVSLHGVLEFLREENAQLKSSVEALTGHNARLQEVSVHNEADIARLRSCNDETNKKYLDLQNEFEAKIAEVESQQTKLELLELRAAGEARKRHDVESLLRKRVDLGPDDNHANVRAVVKETVLSGRRAVFPTTAAAAAAIDEHVTAQDTQYSYRKGQQHGATTSLAPEVDSDDNLQSRKIAIVPDAQYDNHSDSKLVGTNQVGSLSRRMRGLSPSVAAKRGKMVAEDNLRVDIVPRHPYGNPHVADESNLTRIAASAQRANQISYMMESNLSHSAVGMADAPMAEDDLRATKHPTDYNRHRRSSSAPRKKKSDNNPDQDSIPLTSKLASAADVAASRKFLMNRGQPDSNQDHQKAAKAIGGAVGGTGGGVGIGKGSQESVIVKPEKSADKRAIETTTTITSTAVAIGKSDSEGDRDFIIKKKDLFCKQWADSTSQAIEKAIQMRGWKPSNEK